MTHVLGSYHLRVWDDFVHAELVPSFSHVPLLLRTHVGTRPYEDLGQVQVRPLGSSWRRI